MKVNEEKDTKQSFVIVEGVEADEVAKRVTKYLNAGYSLHGELQAIALIGGRLPAHVLYAQAVVLSTGNEVMTDSPSAGFCLLNMIRRLEK